jgi:hypothetical protein
MTGIEWRVCDSVSCVKAVLVGKRREIASRSFSGVCFSKVGKFEVQRIIYSQEDSHVSASPNTNSNLQTLPSHSKLSIILYKLMLRSGRMTKTSQMAWG